MGELLTGIIHQPNFPAEDLSEDNASLLELMMANRDLVQHSHDVAERVSYLFMVGHKTINVAAKHAFDDESRLVALDHGIMTFEAISAMVYNLPIPSAFIPVHNQSLKLTHLEGHKLDDHLDNTLTEFQQQAPRTAEVIRSSSARFHGQLTTYALLGAAMSRSFELSVA